jgi:transposase
VELHAAIDLHSNNSVLLVIDEADRVVYAKRLRNDIEAITAALTGVEGLMRAVGVESTFIWRWLVDGLRHAGYDVRLVNTAAVKQYDGLKHTGDFSDAKHLAQLLRLGILPEGFPSRRSAGRSECSGKSSRPGARRRAPPRAAAASRPCA